MINNNSISTSTPIIRNDISLINYYRYAIYHMSVDIFEFTFYEVKLFTQDPIYV